MNNQIWSWVLSVIGLAGFFLSGKKIWWAWYVNIANQAIWLAYSIVTEQWGFLVATVAYFVVFTKNAIAWTVEHKGLSPFHWRKTKLAHRLGLGSPSFHMIGICWCQKDDLLDWKKSLADGFERIKSIGYVPPNGLKEPWTPFEEDVVPPVKQQASVFDEFDVDYNQVSFLQERWWNDREETAESPDYPFSEEMYFSQNRWRPAEDMEFLPEPPTNFVTTHNVDRRSVCPVHKRAHGWYVCIPTKKDLEKRNADI